MIHSLVTVGVVHGKMNEYTDFVAKEFVPIYQRLGIKMIGSWRSGTGGDNDECLVLFAWDKSLPCLSGFDDQNLNQDSSTKYLLYDQVGRKVEIKEDPFPSGN
jgi:hypothetical protein